jgi:4-amino-4-deoxy-L-arabinose transferase-like glycosyltransferase
LDEKKKLGRSVFENLKQLFHEPLFILILITIVLVIYLLNIQIKIGVPYWDVFNHLNNAIYFAGMGSYSVIIHLPPLIPLLTSLFFRMGYVSIDVIFILSGILFIIGVIGFYLLLKQRFNPIESLTGSIIFISLPLVMSWAVSGGIDLPGIAFSIWAIYFLIMGVKKDSKYLYFVLPLFVITLLTRYTAGLIIIPLLLYLLINIKDLKKLKNEKKIILGICIEFGVLFIIFAYLIMKLDISTLFNMLLTVVMPSSIGAGDVDYNPNILYFVQYSLNYLSVGPFQGTYQQILNPSQAAPSILSYIIGLITLSGLSIYIYRGLTSRIEKIDKSLITVKNMGKVIIILGLITALIFYFYSNSFIISEILLVALLYLLYRFLTNKMFKNKNNNLDLDLMFLSWFCTYLIFHSTLPFKVDRYFISMAPAFTYFIILGLSQFVNEIRPKIKYSNIKSWTIYLIVALVFLSSATATYIGHTPKKTFTVDISDSSDWIKNNDPNYNEKIISSDYPNALSWYLNKEILGGFPRFFNNSNDFADYLHNNSVDYYIDTISSPHPYLEGYIIVKSFGVVAIYKKIS